MLHVAPLKRGSNATQRCGVFASIDTIEVFVPPNVSAEQRRAFDRYGHFKPCGAKNQLFGYRLIVNRPDLKTLQILDRLADETGSVICRFDICLDIQPFDGATAEQLIVWITSAAILKWRRRGPMQDYENGAVYWQMKRRKRPNRNLVVYKDEVNRVTGELNCVHLELRFFRADTIRRQGVERITDLINLNPSELFSKHLKFTDIGTAHVQRVQRQAVKEDREQYRQKDTTEFTDQYRASISRRVRGFMHRFGYDRSQHVRDNFQNRKISTIEPLFVIPHELSW